MPPPDALPLEIPIEIPWQRKATTQKLGPENETLGPDTTTISLFTYEPTTATLDHDYPQHRLVYLKFSVSVSPLACFDKASLHSLFSIYNLPIWRLIFDVRISPEPYVWGGSDPHFLAAAPLRRSIIETGVAGQQATEGESKAVSIGKSAAQMHESYSSKVDTDTSSIGGGINFGGVVSLGASGGSTSTSISGLRDVTQQVDSIQRDASKERSELVSHMTNVTNVLTLLSAFSVGSPYLRFSLWPTPLRPLTIDASDPSLWYAELLRRRSSGIEGIQDFYAIAAVPRNSKGFCVQARLRRFSVIAAPLPKGKELALGSLWPSGAEAATLLEYLRNRYPAGSSVDDLDATPVVYWPKETKLDRPAVDGWDILKHNVGTDPKPSYRYEPYVRLYLLDIPSDFTFQSPEPVLQNGKWISAIYKTCQEVWLQMKKDAYEEELLKSPLANGKPIYADLVLNTCFASNRPQPDFSVSTGNPKMVNLVIPEAPTSPPGARKQDLYRQAVFAWNAAENQFGTMITHGRDEPGENLRLDDPRIVEAVLRRLSNGDDQDSENMTLEQFATLTGMGSKHMRFLRGKGLSDSRGLAAAILVAPVVERLNRRRTQMKSVPRPLGWQCSPGMRAEGAAPIKDEFASALSASEAETIRRMLGVSLQKRYEEAWTLQIQAARKAQSVNRVTKTARKTRRAGK